MQADDNSLCRSALLFIAHCLWITVASEILDCDCHIHFSVALFLFTCLLLFMTSAAAASMLQEKLFTSELAGLVIGNISHVKSPELGEHLLFSLLYGASLLTAHM